jgi:hypothetical protein
MSSIWLRINQLQRSARTVTGQQWAKPYPSGVVILELAINGKGVVVSSCWLRRIRSDFNKAAQLATLGWKFNPYLLKGKPVGVVMTVTVTTPDMKQDGR